ncbi:Sas10 domain-containing protein, partial [Trichostrongylus colubriformis]
MSCTPANHTSTSLFVFVLLNKMVFHCRYMLNMMFFLRLKADSFAKKNASDNAIDTHPVMARIDKYAEMIRKVDAFLDKNASPLKKMLKKASQGQLIESIVLEPSAQSVPQAQAVESTEFVSVVEPSEEDNSSMYGDRRKADKRIEKNSAPDAKRRKKKEARIAKTKNRKRYKEAVKKVHSQVGTLRKELQKYTGESRGIRLSTMVKKYAYINDERLGNVYFPIAAACISGECTDLREKFTPDEEVIFTAQKQAQPQNDCQFVATSVIKKRELIPVSGKICEIYDKYCYAEVKKYGRVFVPYSARNDFNKLNKPWLGYGAEMDKIIQLKIFRQPDIKNCRYVAWSINMNLIDEKKGSDKVHDTANGQIGVIVIIPSDGDLTVYSSQSGKATLPSNLRESWMSIGTCIRYDVVKQIDNESRAIWIVRNVENLGLLYEIINDNKDPYKLLLRLNAVVNRVSSSTHNAWLWNDIIGRIFVPTQQFNRRLRAMICVRVVASWTGTFEDVPWTATDLEVIGDDAVIRVQNASLLQTDDNWTVNIIREVSNVNTNQPTFFGFISNPKHGSAFIAWTDLTQGDTPPAPDTSCRATVFFQSRNGKHSWRAVLVTPLGNDGFPIWQHPLYNHTGRLSLPEHRYKLPPPTLPPAPTSPLSSPLAPIDVTKKPDKLLSPVVATSFDSISPLSTIMSESPEVSPAPYLFSSDVSDSYLNQDILDLGKYTSVLFPHSNNDRIWAAKPIGMFSSSMATIDPLMTPVS